MADTSNVVHWASVHNPSPLCGAGGDTIGVAVVDFVTCLSCVRLMSTEMKQRHAASTAERAQQ